MNTHPVPLKVAVVGARRAGKSALTVRHLTRRYIGEYRSSIDLLYQHSFNVDGVPAQVEILDVSRWTMDDGFPAEHVRWADSLLVVYNVCDKQSFQVAKYLLEHLRSRSGSYPAATLVGTQRDLEHARQVSTDSAKCLAFRHGCGFFEVSSAEDSSSVQSAFQHAVRVARACSEARALRSRKLSLTTVTRALGVLIKTKRPWLSL